MSGIIDVFAHLASPSLSTIALSIRVETHWPISLPDYCYSGRPEILPSAELCLPGWAAVEFLLAKPQFSGLERFVIRGRGDKAVVIIGLDLIRTIGLLAWTEVLVGKGKEVGKA